MTVTPEEIAVIGLVTAPLAAVIAVLWKRNVELEAALLKLAQEGTAASVKLATLVEEKARRRDSS